MSEQRLDGPRRDRHRRQPRDRRGDRAAVRREGAAVAVAARTEEVFDERLPGTIHDTVAAIEADGGRTVAIRADLGGEDDVDRLVAEARAALGPSTCSSTTPP